MARIRSAIYPDVITTCIEQHIAAGSQFDGTAPALGTDTFVPFSDSAQANVFEMMKSDASTAEGDHGGLFTFNHQQPIIVEQIFADLGASVAYSITLVTSAGNLIIVENTEQYVVLTRPDFHIRILPGETLKIVTTGAAAAMWARVYVRLEQAISV